MDQQGQARLVPPVLSEAELARITGVFDNAYKAFAALRLKYPTTTVADLARAEMLAMVNHWRTLAQWQRGAALGERYVGDYLTDVELPKLRLQIARDYLSHATLPPKPDQKRQDAMAELGKRFDKARVELTRIVGDFADKLDLVRDAQWDIVYAAVSELASACEGLTTDGPTLKSGGWELALDGTPVGQMPQVGNLVATGGDLDGEVDLSWDPIRRGLQSYVAEYAVPPAGPWMQFYIGRVSKCTCTGLTSGNEYWFRVRALGAAGPGQWSDRGSKRAT